MNTNKILAGMILPIGFVLASFAFESPVLPEGSAEMKLIPEAWFIPNPYHIIHRFYEHQGNTSEFHLKIEATGNVDWRKEVIMERLNKEGAWEEYALLHTDGSQKEQLAKFTRDMLGPRIRIHLKHAATFGIMRDYLGPDGFLEFNPDEVMGTRITFKWISQ